MYTDKLTKIVATLSPAVATEEMLTKFIQSGVNVFRLNFSHGSYEEYTKIISNIKNVRENLGVNVSILQDLQGPRVRVSAIENPLEISIGDVVNLTYQGSQYDFDSESKILPLDHNLTPILEVGESILIEDGLIELKIKEIVKDKDYAVCEAITNSIIKGRKGVNFPGSSADFPVITEKDKSDLKFGLSQGIDILAMSFVRSKQDIENLRSLIEEDKDKVQYPLVFAKVEKPDAVDSIDDILDVVDGIMVARGDLAIEVPAEEVPVIQKSIIELCILRGKRVIVATQMLDSMIRNPRPTRAEVSDVANAVIDNTDAVMLSGETSGGMYPLEAVQMMSKIIQATELSLFAEYKDQSYYDLDDEKNTHQELSYATMKLSRETISDGILVLDPKGIGMGEHVSKFRPNLPIYVITSNKEYYSKTGIAKGIEAVYVENSPENYNIQSILSTIKEEAYSNIEEKLYFVVVDVISEGKENIQISHI